MQLSVHLHLQVAQKKMKVKKISDLPNTENSTISLYTLTTGPQLKHRPEHSKRNTFFYKLEVNTRFVKTPNKLTFPQILLQVEDAAGSGPLQPADRAAERLAASPQLQPPHRPSSDCLPTTAFIQSLPSDQPPIFCTKRKGIECHQNFCQIWTELANRFKSFGSIGHRVQPYVSQLLRHPC